MRYTHRTYALSLALAVLILTASAAFAAADTPSLSVTAPSQGAVINSSDVQVSFQVSGVQIVPSNVPMSEAGKHPEVNRPGEGHLHLVLDLQPLVLQYSNQPYTFHNVQPGAHQLMVELVNNDHSSLTPPVMQTIQFQSQAPQVLPVTGGAVDGVMPGLLAAGLALLVLGGVLALRSAGTRRE